MDQNLFHDVNDIESLIFQLTGAASVCWEPIPEGVFDSERAEYVATHALARLSLLLGEKVEARVQYEVEERLGL